MVKTIQQMKINDVIEVTDKLQIEAGIDLTNGKRYVITGVQAETVQAYPYIVITDDVGDDLQILASELGAIKWVA